MRVPAGPRRYPRKEYVVNSNLKKNQIGLRLSDEELMRLRTLARGLGIGHHEALRMILKERTDALAFDPMRSKIIK